MAHSLGAVEAERPKAPLAGIAAIGLGGDAAGGPLMQPPKTLERVRTPVLDLYGSKDLPTVVKTAKARAAAAQKAGNRAFQQKTVKGANHFFADRYDDLRSAIADWLARTTR